MITATINPRLWPIVSSMAPADLLNGYFGGSNLTADYLNAYSANGTNQFIGEWLDANLNQPGCPDISAVELTENPDYLLQVCASEFFNALATVFGGDAAQTEYTLRNAVTWFDARGDFFVFCKADSATVYIIRADSEEDAFDELTTRFESAFECDERLRNDNGTPINVDYLQLIGRIVEGGAQ